MAVRARLGRRALTLIELTVALAIFALLGTALVVSLRGGIHAWRRIHHAGERAQRLRFALEQLHRDGAHAVLLSGANDTPPVFTDAQMSFVTATYEPGILPRLERVLVRVEPQPDGTVALVRHAAPYPAAPDGAQGRAQILAAPLTACRFTFLYYDEETRAITWQPTWGAVSDVFSPLPRGIRVAMDTAGDPAPHHVYTIGLPLGHPGQPRSR